MSLMIISDQVLIHSLRDYSGNQLVPEKGVSGAAKNSPRSFSFKHFTTFPGMAAVTTDRISQFWSDTKYDTL